MAQDNIPSDLKPLRDLYLKEEYGQAIDMVLSNKEKFDQGLFHYNLGTLYAKSGKLPIGRYHFEKAMSHGFSSPELRKNLLSTKTKLGLQNETKSLNPITDFQVYLVDFSQDAFILLALTLALLTTLLKFFKFIQSKIVTALCLLLSLSPLLFYQASIKPLKSAITFKPLEVREGPSAIFPVTTDLLPGSKVILGKSSEDWIFIKLPTPVAGWVKKEDLGFL